ncbi:hypothetical protein SNEBB_004385 [Seison nebaliae]|nr:hypothetical protein SNEBB_004385 [Seison nebaliae]
MMEDRTKEPQCEEYEKNKEYFERIKCLDGVNIPEKAKTSEYYKSGCLPDRFEYPHLTNYKVNKEHVLYRTTNSDYGRNKPNVHTMPNIYHSKSSKFTEHLGICGMPRNQGLNTALDKSRV